PGDRRAPLRERRRAPHQVFRGALRLHQPARRAALDRPADLRLVRRPGAAPRMRFPRLKAALANAAIVLASLAIAYLALQFVFFRFLVPDLPPNLRPYLSDRARIFGQTSSRAVPYDYVALLGDSYAEGVGDWMLAAGGERHRPFHSADVIHALSDRDIVSFGRAGAGSAEAMVLHVTRILGGGFCYAFRSVEPPRRFIVYFYEGNDLDDNNALIERAIHARGPNLAAALDAFLGQDYGTASPLECYGLLGEMIERMGRFVIRQRLHNERYIDL